MREFHRRRKLGLAGAAAVLLVTVVVGVLAGVAAAAAPSASTGLATYWDRAVAVQGTVDPGSSGGGWYVEYGPTTAYGSQTAIHAVGGGSQPVLAIITGLDPGTTYHYRVVAQSDGGTTAGDDVTFVATVVSLDVSFPGDGSGTVADGSQAISCSSTCRLDVTLGARLLLSPGGADGSTFTGWGGACAGTGACVVEMSEARQVSASFAKPVMSISAAAIPVSYRASRASGLLQLTGVASAPATYTLRLDGPSKVSFSGSTGVGPFELHPSLPSTFLPGAYVVRLVATVNGTEQPAVVWHEVVAAPPEGVIDRAWASATPLSGPKSRFKAGVKIMYFHFHVVAAPSRPLITTDFTGAAGTISSIVNSPIAGETVHRFVTFTSGFRRGKATYTLRLGKRIIRTITVTIG